MSRSRKHDDALAALRELILASEGYRNAVAHRLGMGVTETQALSNLMAAKAMGQTELADALGITTSSVTSLVDRMERSGLVKRQPHPRDRRRTVVQLTKYGAESVERTRPWFVRAFDEVEDGRLDEVADLLSSLARNLRASTTRIPRS
jgi:DNA-binding MarR family transcriptional regulator